MTALEVINTGLAQGGLVGWVFQRPVCMVPWLKSTCFSLIAVLPSCFDKIITIRVRHMLAIVNTAHFPASSEAKCGHVTM